MLHVGFAIADHRMKQEVPLPSLVRNSEPYGLCISNWHNSAGRMTGDKPPNSYLISLIKYQYVADW